MWQDQGDAAIKICDKILGLIGLALAPIALLFVALSLLAALIAGGIHSFIPAAIMSIALLFVGLQLDHLGITFVVLWGGGALSYAMSIYANDNSSATGKPTVAIDKAQSDCLQKQWIEDEHYARWTSDFKAPRS